MLKSLPQLLLLLISTLGFNLSFANKALSIVLFLQDGTPQTITRWEGSGSSASVNIDGQIVDSGVVDFQLDESKSNSIIFDFSSEIITLDINLLINAPLLENIGEPPAPINLIETALLPDYTIIDTDEPPVPINLEFISEGTVTQPSFSPQDTFLEGSGTIGIAQEPYLAIDIEDDQLPFFFTGGGIVQSGILAGFIYENNSGKDPIPGVPESSPVLGLLGLGLWIVMSNRKKG